MSTDPNAASSGAHQASSDDANSNVNSDNKSVSYDSFQKLLNQRKNDQKKLEELEALKEYKKSVELKAEEEKGNYKDVIDSLRNELKQVKQEKEETTKRVAFDKFSTQVKAVAKESGCVDTEAFMSLLSKDQMASVQVDDSLNANTEDIGRLVTQFKEEKPYMFGSQNVNHTPVNLGGGFKKAEPKGTSEMSKSELKEYARTHL